MRVAVVGSGVAGLSATWLLNDHSEHEVDLYESADYIGGHTHTVQFKRPGIEEDGDGTPVDTGFIVCNPPTYPNFLAFLAHIGVETSETEMTFSVSRDRGAFEWAGKGLPAVFCQGRNLLNPNVYRMVWDIIRFNALCMKELASYDANDKARDDTPEEEAELSIGDFIIREGLSNAFRDDYLLPMTAAIWSTPPDKCGLDFPAKTLIRFMHNHHLLQISGKPKWLVVKGGSSSYIRPVLLSLPKERVHISTPIVSVTSSLVSGTKKNMVVITTKSGEERIYDHVVMACHADTTLKLLGEGATEQEREILGGFEFSKNEVVLHGDPALMPIRRQAWSAWNYLTSSTKSATGKLKANINEVSLTYCMNLLQHIPESKWGPVLCTLNPPFEPKPETIVGRWKYEHPVFTARSVLCQKNLPKIQDQRGLTFVGAWSQYGFHEDGFSSSLQTVSNHLGATPPFPIRSAHRSSPSFTASAITFLTLNIAESIRRLLLWPFGMFAWAVVVGLSLLLQVFHVLGGGDAKKGFVSNVRREIETIRSFWVDDSAVEVKDSKKRD